MRTCMYCGRDLKDNEVCSCAMSVARRQAKADAERSGEAAAENDKREERKKSEQTAYKTGYAGGDNRFERAREKARAKRTAKKNSAKKNASGVKGEFRQNILRWVRNPLDAVINPKSMGKGTMLLASAITGAMLWLSLFLARGSHAGLFGLLASAMGFVGSKGYRLIASMVVYIISGGISGIIMFFIYTGIFYFISRFVMRCRSSYWFLCERLVAAWIPFALTCAVGIPVSLLSSYLLLGIIMCGALSTVLLTYEGLKVEWIGQPPVKIIYSIPLGFFIFFWIMMHIAMTYSVVIE